MNELVLKDVKSKHLYSLSIIIRMHILYRELIGIEKLEYIK